MSGMAELSLTTAGLPLARLPFAFFFGFIFVVTACNISVVVVTACNISVAVDFNVSMSGTTGLSLTTAGLPLARLFTFIIFTLYH
jgi:hypothetical protein